MSIEARSCTVHFTVPKGENLPDGVTQDAVAELVRSYPDRRCQSKRCAGSPNPTDAMASPTPRRSLDPLRSQR